MVSMIFFLQSQNCLYISQTNFLLRASTFRRLVHCHIAWHASEGFSLEIVETESEIVARSLRTAQIETVNDTCAAWSSYVAEGAPLYLGQDDSGI